MYPLLGHYDWIASYGLFLVIALTSCWWLARRSARTAGVDPSHFDLLLPLALIAGIAGSVLLSILYPEDRLLAGQMLQSGLRIRLIPLVAACTGVVFAYSWATRQSFRELADILALPTIVAIMIQRVGCFMAGCCWGDVAVHDGWLAFIANTDLGMQMQTLPWLAGDWVRTAVQFPAGSFAYEQHLAAGLITADAFESLPVHPTQLYESALLIPVVVLLRNMGLGRYARGSVTLVAIVAYALIRFGIEFLRADNTILLADLTITQLQCVVLLVAAGFTNVARPCIFLTVRF